MKRLLAAVLLPWFLFTQADVIILSDGNVIGGNVLRQDEQGVLIQLDYGTFTYPKSRVTSVQREQTNATSQATITERIPPWGNIASTLAKQEWASGLKQIPATVIDTGVLKHVPCISFQCRSGGYEMNVYGDLDKPAGVEIGVLKFNVSNEQARSNCVEFVCAVLQRDSDREMVRRLAGQKDVAELDGLKFEITPPTDPDAYDGWRVSVYDEQALNGARASASELRAITQSMAPAPKDSKPAPALSAASRPTAIPQIPVVTWSIEELSDARHRYSGTSPVSTGGPVYVRGYTRKDGTYVRPHTRRR